MENMLKLLQKYFSETCTDTEKTIIESWINESSDNGKIYNELKEIWENAQKVPDNLTFNHNAAWEKILKSTDLKQPKSRTIKLKQAYPQLLKIASTVLIIIGIGAIIKTVYFNKPDVIIALTNNAEKKEIHLADGSIVFLNKGSELIYPDKFKQATREIELKGEAFFKVAKDKQHPFIVHANGTTTKVLGTSFNINTKNTKQVSIAVFSGKVSFKSVNSNKFELLLVKGETGIYNKTNFDLIKQAVDNDNAIAWQTGIIKFNKTTLIDASNILSEYYSKTIIVSPKLQHKLISVTFNNQPLYRALEIIELTLNVKAISTNNKIELISIEN
jgi:transmembrane sensor